jgi:hypothetical protein
MAASRARAASTGSPRLEPFRFEALAFTEVDLQASASALEGALHRGGGVAAIGQGVKELGGETVVPAVLHDQVDV